MLKIEFHARLVYVPEQAGRICFEHVESRKIRIGGDLSERETSNRTERWQGVQGYDPMFLGSNIEVPIPLPKKTEDIAGPAEGGHELKYHHFSIVMSRSRRIAYVAAVNADGSTLKDMDSRKFRPRPDPRLSKECQLDPSCFRQREHHRCRLVRRFTPAWGDTNKAHLAEEDTYYFTNFVPQHRKAKKRTWRELEDYILERVDWMNIRACILTGPVFRRDDMVYRGELQVSSEFWKVAVALNKQGRLTSAGYLQTNKKLCGHSNNAIGKYGTFRVPVSLLAELTDLDFGPLVEADPRNNLRPSDASTIIRRSEDIDFLD